MNTLYRKLCIMSLNRIIITITINKTKLVDFIFDSTNESKKKRRCSHLFVFPLLSQHNTKPNAPIVKNMTGKNIT